MKGMIFDGESVRQILAGNKTHSRRIIKGAAHSPRYKAGETVYVKESYAFDASGAIHYKADGELWLDYRTPLFMPESLSRIKLQIVRTAIERVHDISLEDIQKEGVQAGQWRARWIEVNGQKSWDSNPWVWVYEFVRV